MESKIIFLGTAGDNFVVGKQLLSSGGIILETEEMQFHIDPGPGSLVRAKQFEINPRNTTGILVSSPDVNLCNDVNVVIDAMTHSGLDKSGVLLVNRLVYEGNDTTYPYITKHHRRCVEKAISLEAGKKVGINNIEIRSLPTFGESENIGFRILTSKFILTYSSHTEYNNELVEHYKDTDILILNVLTPGDKKEPGYLCTEDAIKIAEKVKPKMLIITGFGIKMLKRQVLEEARNIQKTTGVQTLAAKDGLTINPLSYNVVMKQKTLRNF